MESTIMSVAVCWKCGEMKRGAFTRCVLCHAVPQAEHDLAISLGLSEHYCDKPTMERLRAEIIEGQAIHLHPDLYARIIRNLRADPMRASLLPPVPPLKKKAWWKLFSS